jgi:hypothetical protein
VPLAYVRDHTLNFHIGWNIWTECDSCGESKGSWQLLDTCGGVILSGPGPSDPDYELSPAAIPFGGKSLCCECGDAACTAAAVISARSCLRCLAGRFSTGSACAPCDAGTYSAPGPTSCGL